MSAFEMLMDCELLRFLSHFALPRWRSHHEMGFNYFTALANFSEWFRSKSGNVNVILAA